MIKCVYITTNGTLDNDRNKEVQSVSTNCCCVIVISRI